MTGTAHWSPLSKQMAQIRFKAEEVPRSSLAMATGITPATWTSFRMRFCMFRRKNCAGSSGR